MTLLKAESIGLRYDGGPEVINGTSFELKDGDFYYLTGPSGSGKTSLLRMLYIGQLPSRGILTLMDHDIQIATRSERASIRRKIGVIFQNYQLLTHLSLYDNVALPLRLAALSEIKIKEKVNNILDWVGLSDYLHSKPIFLSGGQQQRAAIARAVVSKPKLLLADEPTGSLDDAMGLKIMTLFEELNKTGTTVILATHNESLIKAFPHPRLHLNKGMIHS
jgi:cell division transport system ATP-binding protein